MENWNLKKKEKKHKSTKNCTDWQCFIGIENCCNSGCEARRGEVSQVDYKVLFSVEKKNVSTSYLPIRVIKDKSDENENLQSKIVVWSLEYFGFDHDIM